MFESHLKPPVSFPSVSGSICTFNSQYAALPLKSHTVDIDSVSGVSSINITATYNNLWGSNAVVFGVKNSIPSAIEGTDYIEFAANAASSGSFTESVRFKENTQYTFILSIQNPEAVRSNLRIEYKDGTQYNVGNVTDNTKQVLVFTSEANKTISGLVKRNAGGYTRLFYDECCLLEGVHTEDDFEYFGTFKHIDIGQTVNEATYNARTGVMEVTQPSVQTIQLPPCPIDTLEVNNIWADTGDTTLQYVKFG